MGQACRPVTSSQILVGIGLTVGLALTCQILAERLRLPSIILLLPVGFAAGALTSTVNPDKLFGNAFSPLVSLAVALILFEGGLDLRFEELEGHNRRVLRRLVFVGIPVTWGAATLFSWLFLGLQPRLAVLLGAILIVSGPTVIGPLLALAKPRKRLRTILAWESSLIDPIGAIIAVLCFQAVDSGSGAQATEILHFVGHLSIGLLGAAVGTAVLWFLLAKVRLSGVLATEATIATVIVVAAVCDAFRDDTGLVAAIGMGVALANLPRVPSPENRPFFTTIVQIVIGLLFISISATVTPSSLRGLVGLTLAVVACLVVIVRPLVAATSTLRTDLTRNERVYLGMMDPRGIVAASTAATFGTPLVKDGIPGASKLLPATFVVIVATVTIYGLLAVPATRALRLEEIDDGGRRSSGSSVSPERQATPPGQ